MKICVLILLSGLILCVGCSSQPVQTREYLLRPQLTSNQDYAAPSIGLGNIENIGVDAGDGRYNSVKLTLTVRDRTHLARVMRRVRSNKVVLNIYRKK